MAETVGAYHVVYAVFKVTKLYLGENIVGVVEYRDGTVIDMIKEVID